MLTSCISIKEICEPLKQLDIALFVYIKIFNDNSRIIFCNDYTFQEHYLNQFYNWNIPQYIAFESQMQGTLLLNQDIYQRSIDLFNECFDIFDFDNAIGLSKQHSEYKEIIHFSGRSKNKSLNNFYRAP